MSVNELAGRAIVAVRPMTKSELDDAGWGPFPATAALVLDDGTVLYPSRDGEGNGPGVLFGVGPGDEPFTVDA